MATPPKFAAKPPKFTAKASPAKPGLKARRRASRAPGGSSGPESK